MRKFFLFAVIACAALGCIPGSNAAGLIVVDEAGTVLLPPPRDRPSPPEFPDHRIPRPIHRHTPLEIRSLKVSASIEDQIARTRIEQEFYNPNPRRLEGTFILPLPKGAHLDKFRLEVNGEMVEAELLTADKAKRIYEEIVRKAQDPALLEYVGRDLVKVRIFPIEPNSTKRIDLSYTQLLRSENGLVDYALALNAARHSSTPIRNFSLQLELKSSAPLQSIYSPTHNIQLDRHATRSASVSLEQKEVLLERDFQLFYSAAKTDLGLNLLTYRSPGEDGYFLLLASPAFGDAKDVLPKDVVFVADTSGSMAGKKMEQARKALLFCVNNLNQGDRFQVIRFATETEALFDQLQPFQADSLRAAEQFIHNLKSTGGTAIHDALAKGMSLRPADSTRPYLVVFLTDGLPTIGNTSEEAILEVVRQKNQRGTRVFCFGLGTDVNTRLLDRLAEETSALSQYVLPDEDIEVKVSAFFAKVSDPVLTNVRLEVDQVRLSQLHPGTLPDLFQGQQLMLLGRYSQDGPATATVSGEVGEKRRQFQFDLHFGKKGGHDFIPRLWATRRVGYLLDEIRLHKENQELVEEVTQLAKKYAIVTPYTSYLVTEDQPASTQLTLRPGIPPNRADHLGFARGLPELMERQASTPGAAPVSGDLAVASSRYARNLKLAATEQELLSAPGELRQLAERGVLAAVDHARPSSRPGIRVVGSRTFKLVHSAGSAPVPAWVESGVPDLKGAKKIRLEFNSAEYWDFATRHPELGEVLALGANLQFVLHNAIYEVFSPGSQTP